MAELEIFDNKGKSVGKHKLAEPLAELTVNGMVLHRTVVAEEANSRQGTQSAKTRSETRGGGRKPYKQKKTGNARQGTIRAPHYAHGGMALAIKPRDYSKKVNRKERRLAIMAAFGAKANAGDIVVAKDFKFAAPKTKDAQALLAVLGLGDVKRIMIVVAEHDENVVKSFRNIPNVEVRTAPSRDGTAASFSTRDLLVAHKIVVTESAMKKTEEVWLK
jgi:large subunit ribosomal protein L4